MSRGPLEGGKGRRDDKAAKEEWQGEEQVVKTDVEKLASVPGEFDRIERDIVYPQIARRDGYAEGRAVKRYKAAVFKAWIYRKKSTACSDTEHGNTYNHEGEVVPKRDCEYPRQNNFEGEA
ncbi:hypothetical protein NBG4_230026 [Candidatus Sulfobium mesophilum]|uniref:Uncharacterized protein n=1 Tax=Candidatus Sulfobium mesophilum TaxID=2016548 RepID=A0A2U3QG77_9BACT|nr:hypothetical protein NBG4_230026 [Candidatus Sulfobium mesophilum]